MAETPLIDALLNERLRASKQFAKAAIAKGMSEAPDGYLDSLVDASHTREEALEVIKQIAEVIQARYQQFPGYSLPLRYLCGGIVQLPSNASNAYFKRLNTEQVQLDAAAADQAISMCVREVPREEGFIRRSSGIGFSGDEDFDYMIKNKRQEALEAGLLFAWPSAAMEKGQYTKIHFRLEPKGKDKEGIRDYKGKQYCWTNTTEQDGVVSCKCRPRPFYAHPPTNLGASIMYQLIDGTKDSPTTCPQLDVPIARSIDLSGASSISLADVSRMGTCVPDELNVRIAEKCADVWARLTQVPREYFLQFFSLAAKVPRIRYPKDDVWPIDYTNYIDRENVSIGNADGVGGTTFRNNILCTYWMLILYRQLNLVVPKNLTEISTHPQLRFHYIGDTIMCIVISRTLPPAKQILGKLTSIIEKYSVDGSLAIEDGPTDTWCGYRVFNKSLVVDEVASILKILTPEYEPGSAMRPNPIAGFEAAKAKFRGIPLNSRILTAGDVEKILELFEDFVDLSFDMQSDYFTNAPDLSVYFYDPAYVNSRPPEAYFINFRACDVIQWIRLGYRLHL